jgi:hypothetical protein
MLATMWRHQRQRFQEQLQVAISTINSSRQHSSMQLSMVRGKVQLLLVSECYTGLLHQAACQSQPQQATAASASASRQHGEGQHRALLVKQRQLALVLQWQQ